MRDDNIKEKGDKTEEVKHPNGINGSKEVKLVSLKRLKEFCITIEICDYPNCKIDLSVLEKLYHSDVSHGVTGSQNLGNTCFMNSSIQCLSNSVDLTAYFLSKTYKKDINTTNILGLGGSLAEEWYNLLSELWEKNNSSVNANDFKVTIARKAKMFSGFSQHDSHEFMTFFLDYLSEDLNRVNTKPYRELEEQREKEDDTAAAKRFWDFHLERNNSIITDLFTGQFKSTIQCPECKWVSKTYDPFSTLSLPIPKLIPISMFYVHKYGMRKTIKLNFQIMKKSLFGDIGHIVKTRYNLNADFSLMRFMLVNYKQMLKMTSPKDSIESCASTDAFLFCCETTDMKDEGKSKGEVKYFPLYISLDNDLSAHPRILSITQDMTYDSLIELIFLYIRKFINLPIDQTEYEAEYKKCLNDYTTSSNDLIKICKSEYNQIFKGNKDNDKEKKISNFINNLPYEFYLKKENQYKYIIKSHNDQNQPTESSSLLSPPRIEENISIGDYNQTLEKIFDLLNDKWEFHINLDSNSKYIKEHTSREINACKTIDPNKKQCEEATLTDCLEYFQLTEQLEKNNEWYCKKCKKHLPALKKMEIFYLPKLLVIHLKRFSGSKYFSNKINHDVDFPINDLDMSNFVVGRIAEKMIYDLYAVSQHYGNCAGGHYTAVCKNNEIWYDYDDSSVRKATNTDIVTNAAYVLFYRRKE